MTRVVTGEPPYMFIHVYVFYSLIKCAFHIEIRGVSDVGFPIFADTDADADIIYFIILGL